MKKPKYNKIVIVSSVNLSVNPRALKEIMIASKYFKEVVFVGFDIKGWTIQTENAIKKKLPQNIHIHYISATRKPFIPWFFSSIIHKIVQFFYPLFSKSLIINAYASNKRSYILNNFFKKNSIRFKDADLIVGHTLATLFPAYNFSKKNKIAFGFDVEDYHPGEFIKSNSDREVKRRELLMKNIIPKVDYLTYASPLIGEYTISLTNYKGKHQVINNSFYSEEFNHPKIIKTKKNKVNLVWFSQNISFGRGLELFLPFLEQLDNFHLYLIGNLDANFDNSHNISTHSKVTVLGVMPQDELHASLINFDVGLALDYSDKDLNRKLALTNKIFAYYQAGLYIFSFDTPAQKMFVDKYNCGVVVNHKNNTEIQNVLLNIEKEIKSIRDNKEQRKKQAKDIAWENEQQKLNEIWAKVIDL